MNVLIVGSGKGSWEMRGVQLGAALGARVTTQPQEADWTWAELVVLIKKTARHWAPQAQRHGKPIVWDALDCWMQPGENGFGDRQALDLVRRLHAEIRPALTIAATQAMATDIGGVYLPHHHRLGLMPKAIRPTVTTVAYEGCERYLGQWRVAVERVCQARGWTFVINPPDLAEADIVVAFRDEPWDGWMCRRWKSGIKYVNALAAGRPIIGQPCAAALEIPGAICSIHHPLQLEGAFDAVADPAFRRGALELAIEEGPQYDVAAIAKTYAGLLAQVEAACAI